MFSHVLLPRLSGRFVLATLLVMGWADLLNPSVNDRECLSVPAKLSMTGARVRGFPTRMCTPPHRGKDLITRPLSHGR